MAHMPMVRIRHGVKYNKLIAMTPAELQIAPMDILPGIDRGIKRKYIQHYGKATGKVSNILNRFVQLNKHKSYMYWWIYWWSQADNERIHHIIDGIDAVAHHFN